MTSSNRKNLLILSFTMLVVMLGYSMAMPLLPFYIERFGVGGTELGWLMSTYSLMQLICAPIWGSVSDRYGRKPILGIGVLGYAITLFLFGLATNFTMLFLARAFSGILSSATQPTAMAYIGESTRQQEKSKSMGQLGAMVGLGIILGPLFGGLLSSASLSLPFFVGSGLAFTAFLLVIFLLPESKPAASSAGELSAPGSLAPTSQLDSGRAVSKHPHLLDIYLRILRGPAGILLLLTFIMSFGMTNFQGMIGLYAIDKFAFNTKQVGAIWMVMGGVLILGQGVLVGPLSKRFGDLTLIRSGLLGGAVGFVLVALAVDYITMLLALGLFVLALALIGPALNSCISNFAGEQQGSVMGLNSAATSLGRVVGPLWGGYIYDININDPFFSGAVTFLLGVLVSLIGMPKQAVLRSIKDDRQKT
jgi:MFS transporter, DHA1 family, multidrug resistance protein